MHARGLRLARNQTLSLVVNFAYAAGPGLFATTQFLDGGGTEPRLVVACQIEAAPHLKALGIFRILAQNLVKLRADGHGQDDGLLDADLVHVADPLVNLCRSLGVRMRVHVDDGIFCLWNFRDRNLVDGLRPVVLQKDRLGRSALLRCRSIRWWRFRLIRREAKCRGRRKGGRESSQVGVFQKRSSIQRSWIQRSGIHGIFLAEVRKNDSRNKTPSSVSTAANTRSEG